MGLQRLTSSPPPISLDELKRHMRVDDAGDDALISAYLAAAVDYIEAETRQVLAPATFRLVLDGFPDDGEIRLRAHPLIDVESVEYAGTQGGTGVFGPNRFTIDTSSRPGRIVLNAGETWPVAADRLGSVVVEFSVGHTVESLPPSLAAAVRLFAAHLYENREATADRTITEVPMALQSLIAMNRFQEAP